MVAGGVVDNEYSDMLEDKAQMIEVIEVKKCTVCKRELPATAEFFYRQSGGKNGLASQCKQCAKKYRQTEKGKATTKKYKQSTKGKVVRKRFQQKYSQSTKGKTTKKEYLQRPEIKKHIKEYYCEYGQEYRQQPENKKRIREYRRSTKGKTINKRYAQSTEGKSCSKNSQLKYNYGITLKQHKQMYIDQNGQCAICKQAVPYSKVHTDHNHETGRVRGLLCCGCNTHLGAIENKEFRIRALKYLQEEKNNGHLPQ